MVLINICVRQIYILRTKDFILAYARVLHSTNLLGPVCILGIEFILITII
jgi:hypothetical protein